MTQWLPCLPGTGCYSCVLLRPWGPCVEISLRNRCCPPKSNASATHSPAHWMHRQSHVTMLEHGCSSHACDSQIRQEIKCSGFKIMRVGFKRSKIPRLLELRWKELSREKTLNILYILHLSVWLTVYGFIINNAKF